MAKTDKEQAQVELVQEPILPLAPEGLFTTVKESSTVKTDLRAKLVILGFKEFARLNAVAESLVNNREGTKQLVIAIDALSTLSPESVHVTLSEIIDIVRNNNGEVSPAHNAFARNQVYGTLPDVEPDGTRFDNTVRILNMLYYYASYSKPMFDASVDVEYSVDLISKKSTRQAIASYFNM